MKILLTGASSFTGYWIARALVEAGHQVVAPLRGRAGSYGGGRGERVDMLGNLVRVDWDCPFGSERFLRLAGSEPWDLLCHHAAQVADYRSPDFDVAAALAANTHNLPAILRALLRGGLSGVVITGSVFEKGEGAGTAPLSAFSPYGLAKSFSAEVARYWCETLGVPIGKFVIPNPFGPFEEPRFGAYLRRTWAAGKVAEVKTPSYVRDNIPVQALAGSYAGFVRRVHRSPGPHKVNPSGYVESQGAFAVRMAREFRSRTGLACALELLPQTDFAEPAVRINTDPVAMTPSQEHGFWDEYVASRVAG